MLSIVRDGFEGAGQKFAGTFELVRHRDHVRGVQSSFDTA